MGRTDDKLFEEMLEKAFCEEYNQELSNEPSMEELRQLYALGAKQKREAKALSGKRRKPVWMGYTVKAAAIILCVSLSGFGLLMTDSGIRAAVTENVVKYIEEGFNIDFTQAQDDQTIDIAGTVIGYIPEGFELINERTEENADSLSYSYVNDSGEYIVIDILTSSDIELMSEDEHHDLGYLNIDGYTAYISYSDSQRQGSVYFGNSYFTVAISGMTDREELIKIAENIEIKE
ncbi:MAG: DUF4367 domain-containing protein [Clostridia bacterium]|nr:DUF4367 domain-containing protein [Clostridia bacterium]